MHTLDARPDSAAPDGSDGGGPGSDNDGQTTLLTYEPFFGLREKPFSLSANPKFRYRSANHTDAFARLDAGIRRREGLIVLTGEIGTGKTTLCRAVLEQLDRQTYSTFVVDPFLTREELLKALLVGLGAISLSALQGGRLATASRQELSFALRDFLDSLVPVQAFAVLVIEEAQHLSPLVLEEVRILAELETHHKLIQVVLVGPPELRAALKRPDVRHVEQHVSVRSELSPLDPTDVRGYIAHRLFIAARGSAAPVFTEAAAAIVAAASGGVPRIVNRICDRALHVAWASRTTSIGAETVRSALIDLEVAMPDGPFEEASRAPAVSTPDRTPPFEAAARATEAPVRTTAASPIMSPHAPVPEERKRRGVHQTSSSKHRTEKTALSGRVWGAPAMDADALTEFTHAVTVEVQSQDGERSSVSPNAGGSDTTPQLLPTIGRRLALVATTVALIVLVVAGVGALNMNPSQGGLDDADAIGSLPTVPVSSDASPVSRGLITPDEDVAALNDGRSRAPASYTIRAGLFTNRSDADAFASELAGTPFRTAIRQRSLGSPERVAFELIVEGHGTLENAIATANRLRQRSGGEDAAVIRVPGAFAMPGAPAGADRVAR